MVGRERELALLRSAFERTVSDQACQLFTVLGVGGVGKSRLMAAFVEEIGDRATDPARPVPPLRRGHHVLPPGRGAHRDRGSARGRHARGRPRQARGARRVGRERRQDRRAGRTGDRHRGKRERAGGDVLGDPDAAGAPRRRSAARLRDRRSAVGRAEVLGARRTCRGLRAGRLDPARVHGPPRAPGRAPGMGRREAERDVDPDRTARSRGVRHARREPVGGRHRGRRRSARGSPRRPKDTPSTRRR